MRRRILRGFPDPEKSIGAPYPRICGAARMARAVPGDTHAAMAIAISRSRHFPDADELGIWEWLEGGPFDQTYYGF